MSEMPDHAVQGIWSVGTLFLSVGIAYWLDVRKFQKSGVADIAVSDIEKLASETFDLGESALRHQGGTPVCEAPNLSESRKILSERHRKWQAMRRRCEAALPPDVAHKLEEKGLEWWRKVNGDTGLVISEEHITPRYGEIEEARRFHDAFVKWTEDLRYRIRSGKLKLTVRNKD